MKNNNALIPLEEAYRIVDETLADAKLPGQTISVRLAAGRVLLNDEVSRLDLPPFDKSAMDGYAILNDDERNEYRLLETVPAGRVGTAELVPGATVKVMTGSGVPAGTGKVVMIEQTEERDGIVRVLSHKGTPNICRKAEDVHCGQTILSAGTKLSALDVANLIGCGITEVEVASALRVAIISTGDEIVDSPDLLLPGKIMNTNGPLLAGLSKEFGFEVVSEESLPDDRDATLNALRLALERADAVMLSGGVSVGEFDFVSDALADLGLTVHFSRVAVKPGKPMTYATAPGAGAAAKVVFGLPGNPVSVLLMFHLFVLRAAALMTGQRAPLREFTLRLAADFKRWKTRRAEYLPCRLAPNATIEQIEFHGSAHLTALTHADGFFVVPQGTAALSAGDDVVFVPIGSTCR